MHKTMLALAALVAAGAQAKMLRVPQQYSTIGAAVAAASPGDTVQVAAGTYAEQVELKDQVNLSGDPAAVIEAGGVAFGIHGGASIVKGLTISGFTIKNAQVRDVMLRRSNHVTIDGTTVASAGSQGIFAVLSNDITVKNITAYNNGCQAVFFRYGSGVLQDSNIHDHGCAGVRYDHASGRVLRNRFTRDGGVAAIRSHQGSIVWVEDNVLTDNRAQGIGVTDSDDTAGNDGSEAEPAVVYSRNNKITGTNGFGIYVANSTIYSRNDSISKGHNGGVLVLNGGKAVFRRLSSSGNANDGVLALGPQTYCFDGNCNTGRLENAPPAVKIVGSNIFGNFYNGVVARAGARVSVIGSAITGNGTSGAGSGLLSNSFDVESVNNNNDTTINIASQITARGSLLADNASAGASVTEDSHLDLGIAPPTPAMGESDEDDEGEALGGQNTITGNKGNSIQNLTPNNVAAQGNWFGTTDANAIRNSFDDCNHGGSRGCVLFTPFLTAAPDGEHHAER